MALFATGFIFFFTRGGRVAGGKVDGAARARRSELVVLLLAFVAAYFVSHLPFFIAGRYRVPLIPVLLLFGAYGIESVRAMAAARDFKRAALWAGVFGVGYLIASRPLVPYKPDLGTWHFDRGDAYRKQGKPELALAEFRMAVELGDRPNAVAYNNLGAALDQAGRREEAAASFERAVAVSPNYIDARRNLVSVLLRLERIDAAVPHLREIVRLEPQDASARFNLGVCLLRQSKTDEAIGSLVEAVRLNPNHFYARFFLARALVLVGRLKDAVAHYAEAVRIDGNQADARYELAELLADAGEKEQAIAHLRRVLASKPDHAAARELLRRLGSE
jgi:tetratricopeptide (TPR) repeat protein